jgi:hypothetical protein
MNDDPDCHQKLDSSPLKPFGQMNRNLVRRRFLEIDQLELPVTAIFVNGSGRNEQSL